MSFIPAFLIRLLTGYLIFKAGWGKVQDLNHVIENFTKAGIPMPAFNAVLVSYTEFIGGILLMVGLFTRLASIPLLITMIVAIVVVHVPQIKDVNSFAELSALSFGFIFLWLIFAGPGLMSLDAILFYVWKRSRKNQSNTTVPSA